MSDQDKTKEQLLAELEDLRRQVAERKQAEEAFHESEARLRQAMQELRQSQATLDAFFNASTAILNISDEDCRYIKSSRQLADYFGLDPQGIVGKTLAELDPPFFKKYGPMFQRVIETGEPIHNFEMTTPLPGRPGEVVYWRASHFPVPLPDGRRGRGTVSVDITDIKRAEVALRQSYDELATIYDGMFDGLLVADLETKQYVKANPSICRMLGYEEKELLSMSIGDIHPADEAPVVLERIQARVEGRFHGQVDTRLLRKDGAVRYANVASSPIIYRGRPSIVGFFRDVTERKRAEEATERERRTLRHLLQSSDHERQLIAYEIHDGLAQELAGALMQFDAFDHLRETRPKQAADALHAAVTMLRQAHYETRRLISGVRPPILDEEGIVAAVGHFVNEERRKRGPVIEFQAKVQFDRLAPILENAVYRIAQEALTNACRHSQAKKVLVELVQEGDQIRVEVHDRGLGFKPEDVGEGRFGLAGIRERARLLGGTASIESAPGAGTRIMVQLPIVLREPDDE
jgi:PAS domain S-box-containing protein